MSDRDQPRLLQTRTTNRTGAPSRAVPLRSRRRLDDDRVGSGSARARILSTARRDTLPPIAEVSVGLGRPPSSPMKAVGGCPGGPPGSTRTCSARSACTTTGLRAHVRVETAATRGWTGSSARGARCAWTPSESAAPTTFVGTVVRNVPNATATSERDAARDVPHVVSEQQSVVRDVRRAVEHEELRHESRDRLLV